MADSESMLGLLFFIPLAAAVVLALIGFFSSRMYPSLAYEFGCAAISVTVVVMVATEIAYGLSSLFHAVVYIFWIPISLGVLAMKTSANAKRKRGQSKNPPASKQV